jgi:putative ABC transport system permease protein
MVAPVILRLARRYIARRLLQSVLFVVGIALGVAVMIAIDLANGSASRAFSLSTESVTGRATHQIIGGPAGLPTDLYRQLRIDLRLDDAAPIVEEYVRASSLNGQILHILGIDPFAEPPFRDYLTNAEVEGESANALEALNAFIAQPSSIVISRTLADRFDLSAGDEVMVQAEGQSVTVRIIGILTPADSVSEQALDTLVLTDIATAQEILGRPGFISRIDLILPDDYDTTVIEAILPGGVSLTTPQARAGAVEQMTAAFELNLQALSLLALVVGVFLIYNTVTFSVVQRRPVIGILRALGTTRRQVFLLILGEALLLGIIGSVLGMALGILFGRGAVGLVAQTVSDLYFTVNVRGVAVDPLTLLKGAAVGIGASLAAAAVPSFEATRTPPAGTMRRSEVESGARKLLPLLTVAAVLLGLVGAGLLALPTQNLFVSFGALFAIILGGALFTPIALVTAMRLATAPMNALFGVVGRMAPRAVARTLSRTSVAVAALTVAVSVIVGVSVMIASFRSTVADWLNTTLGADIFISPPNLVANRATVDVDSGVIDLIAGIDGVERTAFSRSTTVNAPDFPDLPPVNLITADTDIARETRRFQWLLVPRDQYWEALAQPDTVVVSEPFAFRRGITPDNNTLRLLTDRGEQTFRVIGVYFDYSTDQGLVLMRHSVYQQWYDDPAISSVAAFVAPDADGARVLEDIRVALQGTELIAQSNVALRQGVFTIFERAFAITYALQLLATVVAFIGVLSALLALQLENVRQYGTMRAVGLTPGQLRQFTLLQTGLMGTVAGGLALPIGVVLALVLIYVINVRSFGWTMDIVLQASEFGLAFGVAVLSSVAAGIYPAHELARLVVARALRSE